MQEAATRPMTLPKLHIGNLENKAGVQAGQADIVNSEVKVDIAAGVASGIALSDVRGIEVDTDNVMNASALALEKFMHEPVTIQLMPPANENDHRLAEITVNGLYRCMAMGEQYTIPRTHVAALANAKSMRVTQEKLVNPDGSVGFAEKGVVRQMYPFSVVHDANPRGVAWLMQLLKNPG